MEAEERTEESRAKEHPGVNGWVRRVFMKICLHITRSDRSKKRVMRTARHVEPLRVCTRLMGDAEVPAKKKRGKRVNRILSRELVEKKNAISLIKNNENVGTTIYE